MRHIFEKIKNKRVFNIIFIVLGFILAFSIGFSLGITQKQAIRAIFNTPLGYTMEFSPDFFEKMDKMFQMKNNSEKNFPDDNKLQYNFDNYKMFVASKIGKKYYPIDCAASQKLSEKNKIYFRSEDEAKLAGYSLSKSCQ